LRGKEITAEFHVLEVKRLELPEMTPELLAEIGEFDDEGELRDAVKANLERRLDYHQKQEVRKQITALLTESANWELPPDLLRRQSDRELERSVMELQRSGFSIPEIRAHANQLRQNSQATTAVSLKEHFILERIAEAEEIDATDADFDEEIALIALQSDESPRRVRAKLEKRGVMDVLQNQIIERKVVDLVRSHATFEDVPYETGDEPQEEALDRSAGGSERESDIPEAKPGGQQEELAEPKDHT
jgi:trigger factor